ncbi:TPM domain-containing protein [Geminocystis sp. CENA526]|uniref:TPM domain-containing protein n=1 Tax=Geminocystis sp. CENA526 TaxID=1355871 RepID=UPI003D6F00FF
MKIKTAYQKFFLGMLLCLSIFIFPLISHSLTIQEVPNPRQIYNGWVSDMANILSEKTKQELNREISELEAKNGTEIAIVTVDTTQPYPTPKQFTTELFNHWGIGKKDMDNGILFLVSIQDRRVEIETGYGVEGILPDAKVGNIINQKITPEFKKGNFDKGILDGTKALIQAVNLADEFDSSYLKEYSHNNLLIWIFISGLGSSFLLNKEGKKLLTPIYVDTGEITYLESHKKYPSSWLFTTMNFIFCLGFSFLVNFFILQGLLQSSIYLNLNNFVQYFIRYSDSGLLISFYILTIFWSIFLYFFVGHFEALIEDKAKQIKFLNSISFFLFSIGFIFVNILLGTIFYFTKPVNVLESINNFLLFASICLSLLTIIPLFKLVNLLIFNGSYRYKTLFILLSFTISLVINWLIFSFIINNITQYFFLSLIIFSLIYFIISELILVDEYEKDIRIDEGKKLGIKILWGIGISLSVILGIVILSLIIGTKENVISGILSLMPRIQNSIENLSALLLDNRSLKLLLIQNNLLGLFLSFVSAIMAIFSTNIYLYFILQKNPLDYSKAPRFYCSKSRSPMELIKPSILTSVLTPAQQVAQRIGSVEFEGWKSPLSKDYQQQNLYIRAYTSNNSRFQHCPHCQELTMIKTAKVTRQATTNSTGIELITSRCQCCDYVQEIERIIPIVVYVASDSYSGGSSGGSSDGGGSFGGGDSGGGGAGGDW